MTAMAVIAIAALAVIRWAGEALARIGPFPENAGHNGPSQPRLTNNFTVSSTGQIVSATLAPISQSSSGKLNVPMADWNHGR